MSCITLRTVGCAALLLLLTTVAHAQVHKTPGSGKSGKDSAAVRPALYGPLALTLTMDRQVYSAGSPIKLTMTVKNVSKAAVRLHFASGQMYDFLIRKGTDREAPPIWQWSSGQVFAQMLQDQKLEPGKVRMYAATCSPSPDSLRPGTYTVTGVLTTMGDKRPTVTRPLTVK